LKKDIAILTILAFAATLILVLTANNNGIDIQLHDTYYVIDNISLALLVIGPLTFLIFLSLGLLRRFRKISTNLGFMIGLLLVSLIIYIISQIQISYRDQIQFNSDLSALPMQLSIRKSMINDLNKNITITFVVLGVFLTGIGIIGFRIYRLVTNKKK